MILISVANITIQSIPQYSIKSSEPQSSKSLTLNLFNKSNQTSLNQSSINQTTLNNPQSSMSDFRRIIYILEIICNSWFIAEFTIRLVVSPCKLKFLASPLNIIDFITIIPFIVVFVLQITRALAVVKFLSVIRVLLIIKIARHSKNLQSFGYVMKMSYREFLILVMYLSIGVMIFSCFVYYAEMDQQGSSFVSIPASFWFFF